MWRPASQTWYLGGVAITPFGAPGDIPVAGDFTGDGTADLATWHPSDGTWIVLGAGSSPEGQAGDVPLSG